MKTLTLLTAALILAAPLAAQTADGTQQRQRKQEGAANANGTATQQRLRKQDGTGDGTATATRSQKRLRDGSCGNPNPSGSRGAGQGAGQGARRGQGR